MRNKTERHVRSTRPELIQFRATVDERKLLEAAARKRGYPDLSKYLRRCALERAARDVA